MCRSKSVRLSDIAFMRFWEMRMNVERKMAFTEAIIEGNKARIKWP
jgi:hypothetical protein